MRYTTFSQEPNDATLEPIFFGTPVNLARYDKQKFPKFEKLCEKQISFFWRPEEIDVSKDRADFQSLTKAEQHIFTANLKYQILLDSIQGRSPNVALLPIVTIPEAETFIETWSFFETIHSRSYTHIIKSVYNEPSDVFDSIVIDPEIQKRAGDISRYYDDLIHSVQGYQYHGAGKVNIDGNATVFDLYELKRKLYLCVCSVNALEAIRFYVSVACNFAFFERRLMTGSGKIMKLIARDESLHMTFTQHLLNIWRKGKDDPEMAEIAEACKDEARQIFLSAVEQEKQWARYLFSEGTMLGLNAEILCQYIEYLANERMDVLGMETAFPARTNPILWIDNHLKSDNVQDAPQEIEITAYLTGQIDADVDANAFENEEL